MVTEGEAGEFKIVSRERALMDFDTAAEVRAFKKHLSSENDVPYAQQKMLLNWAKTKRLIECTHRSNGVQWWLGLRGELFDPLDQKNRLEWRTSPRILANSSLATSSWTTRIDSGRAVRRAWCHGQTGVLRTKRFAAISPSCGFRRAAGAERLKARNQLPLAVADQISAAHIF